MAEDPQAARPLAAGRVDRARSGASSARPKSSPPSSWRPSTGTRSSLLLWQAPLPDGDAAKQVQAFIDRGGSAIFFPPRVPGAGRAFGRALDVVDRAEVGGARRELARRPGPAGPHPERRAAAGRASSRSGSTAASRARSRRWPRCKGGAPLLARVTTDRGAAYFCATTPAAGDSSLATERRRLLRAGPAALAAGAAVLGSTRQLTAGEPPRDDPTAWKRVAGAEEAISTEYPFHRGVYQAGDRLLAVNRAAGEDSAPVLADRRVAELFRGLDFARVDDRAGSFGSLIQEIWRLFLVAMMVAMVAEAALCLPKLARPRGAAS